MEKTATRPAIRSVLIECKCYRDSANNTYTSALVWMNGYYVGQIARNYGQPEDLEHYVITPLLEAWGILPNDYAPGEYRPHVKYRLRAAGIDYYDTRANGRKKDTCDETILPDTATFWEELARRENEPVRL